MYARLLIEDQKLAPIISWLPEEKSFQIFNVTALTDNVLPLHFKHSNMASFVRQLNMYGFSRPLNSHQHVYMHPKFQKGNFPNMKFIKKTVGNIKLGQNESNLRANNKESGKEEYIKIDCSYEKLKTENKELKRQNEELKLRLLFFEEAVKRTNNIFCIINQVIEEPFQETENEKSEKLAISEDSTEINSSTVGKSAFRICKTDNQIEKNENNNRLARISSMFGTNSGEDSLCI